MATPEKAYDEIIELFARGASPAEIVRFRPSHAARERARYLLERNKTGALTEDEEDELERLGQVERFMELVKARARLHGSPNSC